MNWMQEARSFPECNITRVRSFASDEAMKQAIAQYNRAVRNLHNDSMDISIIALRNLASRYPAFAQAVLLYGCCLMASGHRHAGTEVFETADADTFTDRNRAALENYLEGAREDLAHAAADDAETAADPEFNMQPSAPVIQRGSSSSRRVRMASSKEKRAAAGGAVSDDIREPLSMRYPILGNIPRLLAAVVVLVLVVAAVFGLIRLIGNGRTSEETATEGDRLEWVLQYLANAGGEEAVDPNALLQAYQEQFGEDASLPTSQTTTAGPTVTPTSGPSPTPTATPVPETQPDYTSVLQSAYGILEDARGRAVSQPIESLRLLNSLPDLLTSVPGTAEADDVPFTAAEILDERAAIIAANQWTFCESHRVAAETPWRAQDYAGAMPYYEAIYRINPVYYTGYVAFRLGLCYEQVGATEQALACYRTVQEIGSASPQYPGAMARIQSLT